ncbi:MAG TPA: hypothetical protein PLL66_05585 [Bacteroidales bacterium]|nr:hypothetical protein [Bacteroidales bacterium]
MNKQSKILVSFLLILVFNIPFIGYYSVYNFRRLQIKDKIETEIRCGIAEENLVELTFTREQSDKYLTWISKREFKYSEFVYRVVKVRYSGENIIYYCSLNPETLKIVNSLDKLVNIIMGHNADKQSSEILLCFMKNVFQDNLKSGIDFQLFSWGNSKSYYYSDFILVRYIDIVDPPPKFIIC